MPTAPRIHLDGSRRGLHLYRLGIDGILGVLLLSFPWVPVPFPAPPTIPVLASLPPRLCLCLRLHYFPWVRPRPRPRSSSDSRPPFTPSTLLPPPPLVPLGPRPCPRTLSRSFDDSRPPFAPSTRLPPPPPVPLGPRPRPRSRSSSHSGSSHSSPPFVPSTRLHPPQPPHNINPQSMPSSPYNTTSSNRDGGPPPYSLRALAKLELRHRLRKFRHSVLGELILGHRNVSPASPYVNPTLTSSSGACIDANSTPDPLGGVQTGPAPVQGRDRRNTWSGATSLVPLGPRPFPCSSSHSPPPFAPSMRLSTPPPPHGNNPQSMLSSPYDTTSSSNRCGRPPPSSVRAFAKVRKLELRRQHSTVHHSVINEPSSKPSNVAPASPRDAPTLSSSGGDVVHAISTLNPRGGAERGPTTVQALDRRNTLSGSSTSLVPTPLNLHRPRPHSSHSAPLHTSNVSRPLDAAAAGLTTDIPVPIVRARSLQQDTELELAMAELETELDSRD